MRSTRDTFDDPLACGLRATAENGMVLIDGIAVAMTLSPDAAKDLAEQLYAAVVVALAQRVADGR